MCKRCVLLITIGLLSLLLAGCTGVQPSAQKDQQPKSPAPSAKEEATPPPAAPGDAPVAGNAENPAAALPGSAPASPQIAQAVSSYVENNNPSVTIDNSTTTIKYNSDNSTAVAATNTQTENTQPTQIYVLLVKDANGVLKPQKMIDKGDIDDILDQGGQDTTGPGTTNQTPSCTGASGNTIYKANWSGGMNGWAGPPSWKAVNGQLVNDGSSPTGRGWISAPCKPETANYAVEAEIQLIPPASCMFVSQQFGVGARADEQGGILGGFLCSGNELVIASTDTEFSLISNAAQIGAKDFAIDGQWHTYRLEVQGNAVRFLVDGAPFLNGTDNRRLDSGEVGMFDSDLQINVRSFEITKL